MKTIEVKMNQAIQNEKDCKLSNTQVVNIKGLSFVYLYNHLIAIVDDTSIQLFDGGHQTKTTKSRLNAILAAHGNGEYIFQKNFQWFIQKANGPVLFEDGMILD